MKPGRKKKPENATQDPMLLLEGKAIRRNVLFDQKSLDYYRKAGQNNISAGIRLVAKREQKS